MILNSNRFPLRCHQKTTPNKPLLSCFIQKALGVLLHETTNCFTRRTESSCFAESESNHYKQCLPMPQIEFNRSEWTQPRKVLDGLGWSWSSRRLCQFFSHSPHHHGLVLAGPPSLCAPQPPSQLSGYAESKAVLWCGEHP